MAGLIGVVSGTRFRAAVAPGAAHVFRAGFRNDSEGAASIAVEAIAVKKILVTAMLVRGLAFGADAPAPKAEERAPEKRAAIIGTTTAAGAAIGAAMAKDNRVKGAIIGAAVGGIAGFVFDHMSKKKDAEPAAVPAAAETK